MRLCFPAILFLLTGIVEADESGVKYILDDEDLSKLNDTSCAEICVPTQGPCLCLPEKSEIVCQLERLLTANLCAHPKYDNVTFRHVQITGVELGFVRKGSIFPEISEQITELDMSDNMLKELPDDAFMGFDRLEELNLAHNRIQRINRKTFLHLPRLHTLDLRHNEIADLTEDPFESVSGIYYLYLDGNAIEKINDQTFAPLENLLYLSIDNAHLSTVEDSWFRSLKNLKTLSLNHNNLILVPDLHLPNLESLSMTDNDFTEIGTNAFDGLQKLQQLVLKDQKSLWLVDDCAFCILPNLDKLEVARCPKLESFSGAALGDTLPKDELDLSGNNLESLDEGLVSDWSKIRQISLEENSWVCDCSIAWMTKIKDAQNNPTLCANPKKHRDRDIRLLHYDDFGCREKRGGRAYVVVLFLILVLSGIGFSWFVWPGKRAYKERCLPIFSRKSTVPQYSYNNLATEAQGDDKMNLVTEDVLEQEHQLSASERTNKPNGHVPDPVML